MKYELNELERLISELSTDLQSDPYSQDIILDIQSSISTEVVRIKNSFKRIAFSDHRDLLIERYMQNHQSALVDLADKLWPTISDDKSKINQYTYDQLDDLIRFLEKFFSKYFNPETKIPESYRLIAIRELRPHLKQIQSDLEETNLDMGLIKIVLSPLRKLVHHRSSQITFSNLIFCKTLFRELSNFREIISDQNDPIESLICSMIYLNFNSIKFFTYCTSFIKSCYQSKETLVDQLDKLAWFSKTIGQAAVKPCFTYQAQMATLKDQLLEWIEQETSYLERRHQLSLNLPVNKVDGLPENYKLTTGLSVAQLAYFTKLLLETKVILNRNHKEVLKFISHYFRSKKAENISFESMRTKFYNIESNTREAVREIVSTILNEVRKT